MTYPIELLRMCMAFRTMSVSTHPTWPSDLRTARLIYPSTPKARPLTHPRHRSPDLPHPFVPQIIPRFTASPVSLVLRSCATPLVDLDIGALAGTVAQMVSWRTQVATLPIHSERGPVVQNRDHPDLATVTEHASLTTSQVDAEAAPASEATSLTLISTSPQRLRLTPLPTTATLAPIEGNISDNLPPSDSGANFRPSSQDPKQHPLTLLPATYCFNNEQQARGQGLTSDLKEYSLMLEPSEKETRGTQSANKKA
ncbi:hypothetical protein EDB92DRAFT_2035880 [Lactarius akahatsu]|uniref:Uncharacterized protein n=1 Tax=Lactarius akahatsu TaxID=416441 RepID=A0AAD4QG60_9AGAM|nr:hypothetical protein EDB92DRAFT_2035880 [Lactarius akahatsu]